MHTQWMKFHWKLVTAVMRKAEHGSRWCKEFTRTPSNGRSESPEYKSRSVHQFFLILLRSNSTGTIFAVGTRWIPNISWFSSNLLLASSALNHYHHFLLKTLLSQSSIHEKLSSYSETNDCLLPQRLILYGQNWPGPHFTQLVE